jgi:hypothetical protein
VKVLTVGIGASQITKDLWEKPAITNLTGSLQGKKKDGRKFDAVVSFMALQRVANGAVHETLKSWRHVLRPGGELHLFVPSLEWAARELLAEDPSPLLLSHMYGLQLKEEQYWLSGHTLRRIRVDIDHVNMTVEAARVGYYSMDVGDTTYRAEQHYVLARK